MESNQLEYRDGWVYIQLQTCYITAPAPEVTPYGKRKVQPEHALKGKGCYLDNQNQKETKINLSSDSQEWIKDKFEEYQDKYTL